LWWTPRISGISSYSHLSHFIIISLRFIALRTVWKVGVKTYFSDLLTHSRLQYIRLRDGLVLNSFPQCLHEQTIEPFKRCAL
jgi:hypothetical protein